MPDTVGWRRGGDCFHECVSDELQLDLEIALSGASAKVKPPTGFSARPKVRWDVGWRNRGRFYQHSRQPYMGL